MQAGVPSIVTGPIFAIISDVYGRRYLCASTFSFFVISGRD